MAKRNPFDQPPPPPVFRPDADLQNADWSKKTHDVSADGSVIPPKVIPKKKR